QVPPASLPKRSQASSTTGARPLRTSANRAGAAGGVQAPLLTDRRRSGLSSLCCIICAGAAAATRTAATPRPQTDRRVFPVMDVPLAQELILVLGLYRGEGRMSTRAVPRRGRSGRREAREPPAGKSGYWNKPLTSRITFVAPVDSLNTWIACEPSAGSVMIALFVRVWPAPKLIVLVSGTGRSDG